MPVACRDSSYEDSKSTIRITGLPFSDRYRTFMGFRSTWKIGRRCNSASALATSIAVLRWPTSLARIRSAPMEAASGNSSNSVVIKKTRPSRRWPWSLTTGKQRESGSSRLMVARLAISLVRSCW